jgi:hypothetical protein
MIVFLVVAEIPLGFLAIPLLRQQVQMHSHSSSNKHDGSKNTGCITLYDVGGKSSLQLEAGATSMRAISLKMRS